MTNDHAKQPISAYLSAYLTYWGHLRTLSGLDLVLLTGTGEAVAEMITLPDPAQEERKAFVSHILASAEENPEYLGTDSPFCQGKYWFHAQSVFFQREKYFLCVGPFLLTGEESSDTDESKAPGCLSPGEARLPCCALPHLTQAMSLFRFLPEEYLSPSRQEENSAFVQKELEFLEVQRLNPPSRILYNATHEKIIRSAISSGDLRTISRYVRDFEYERAEHMLMAETPLRRAKHGISSANSVYCRAAEDGGASSVMVRSICAEYADRIEHASAIQDLIALRKEAALIYCRKVREAKQK